MNNRLKSPFQVFIYAIGTLFLTLGDTATAKERKIYTEMPKLVEQALVRELGAKPKITGIRG